MFQRYKEAVSYIETLSNSQKSLNPSFFPEKMQYFLDLIGNPEKGLKYVHVTGTAGKGTVSSLIHSALVADSRSAGLFTSPYATTAIEEIKVGDSYISPEDFVDIVECLKPFVEKASQDKKYGRPSAFNLFFAIALIYFKKQKCEWAVIEVGVGGRFDATNVIKDPKATVITHIDFDHTEVLGKTMREIALDKAGIIKKGSQFFTAEPRKSVKKLFELVCAEQGTVFHATKSKKSEDSNKSLAREVAKSLGVSDEGIERGLAGSIMPCRFEIMEEKPFIILDGAHNRSKMRNTVNRLRGLSFKKLIVIIAISNLKKDNTDIFKEIIPLANHVILTSFNSSKRKSMHPNAVRPLIKKFLKRGATVEEILDPQKALDIAIKTASKKDCIIATGSFFLSGELRKRWFSEDFILKHGKSFR